jgi:hypothetical protein
MEEGSVESGKDASDSCDRAGDRGNLDCTFRNAVLFSPSNIPSYARKRNISVCV